MPETETYGGIRLNTEDDAMMRKAKRYRKRMLWRAKWGIISLLWLVGFVKLYQYDRESIKLYTIFSILMLIYVNLSKTERKEGELSAYYILNPDCKRLDGEVGLDSFGIKEAKKNSSSGSSTSQSGGLGRRLGSRNDHSDDDEEENSFFNKRKLTDDEVQRLRQDPVYQAELSRKRGLKKHHLCPCGSAKRFGACCEPLYLDLRQRGVHLQQ